ncbi:MAG TPA: folylpolyglutamate synthase/dihydrofolate synthase family protein [Bacteroidales bacterium]|nr:folylpolyglutamate synthase/dihydrofolate synthase family protein [Bacteroidales bacterium]
MNYSEALHYLFEQLPMFHRVGAAAYKNNLDNTLAICRLLGNPENKFRSVHVAGTNGKGSVSHMLASIFQEAGYKTGLFTSPHLKDFRERIRINGKMIPRSEVIRFIQEHRKDFEAIQPSFFEWTWGLASQYFAKQQVDIAILETGMGGRLDSTNVVIPELSVITNISFDHMQFLGDTLAKIAAEKAGIMKPGIPAVIGETHPETQPVFRQKALETDTTVCFADETFAITGYCHTKHQTPMLRADVFNRETRNTKQFITPLAGIYQLKNIITVLQAVDLLRDKGFNISEQNISGGIRNVLKNTHLQGRWQVIGHKPLTVADIGHNKDGITKVLEQVSLTRFQKLHIVTGVVSDKDVDAMLSLLPRQAAYYFCKADIPRGLDAGMLKEKAGSKGLAGNTYTSVKKALEAARNAAGAEDLVLVTGSAFVVAEVV